MNNVKKSNAVATAVINQGTVIDIAEATPETALGNFAGIADETVAVGEYFNIVTSGRTNVLLGAALTYGAEGSGGPAVISAVTATRAGTSDGVVGTSGTPTAVLDVTVIITTLGATGVAVFKYSKDSGATWTEDITTAASVLIGDGVSVTFTDGTTTPDFDVDDKFEFTTAVAGAVVATTSDKYTVVRLEEGGAIGDSVKAEIVRYMKSA